MIYKRHYVQFNDLVFDGYDMIEETDTSVSFKVVDHEYTFRHGSYVPFKQKGMLAEAGSVSMTLYLKMKKLPCDYREFYPQFVVTQLTTQGKLWAVQNNTLIWAYAFITEYTMSDDAKKDTLQVDVEFMLPEGVWHKADKQRTFLRDHDICNFMECYKYQKIQPCKTDCCHCTTNLDFCDCCFCYELTEEMALCHFDDLQDFYNRCDNPFHIVYDCARGDDFFFKDFYSDSYIGQRFCSDCGDIFGRLYSDTEIPTQGVKITIHGNVSDPRISINDNVNVIKGEYNGILTIYPDGSVYFSEGCGCGELQEVGVWEIPDGMEYGWTVYPGYNHVRVTHGGCGVVCMYIEVDSLTI